MTTIPLLVNEATARAFEAAEPSTRERIARLVQGYVSGTTLTKRQRAERFRRVADETGREAQANGWNDELDAALLRGDFDDDE